MDLKPLNFQKFQCWGPFGHAIYHYFYAEYTAAVTDFQTYFMQENYSWLL
jgi:hypothetical protein